MKTITSKYIVAALIATATFTGCADLDQEPLSSIDRDNFFGSKEDIETAINGIYEEFSTTRAYISTTCSRIIARLVRKPIQWISTTSPTLRYNLPIFSCTTHGRTITSV